MTLEWIAFALLVGGPVTVALMLVISSATPSHREAAARYGRRGYEALGRVQPDPAVTPWRDALDAPVALGLRPDGSVFYATPSSIPIPADAPTGPITGILPTYRGEPL
jgi:hypothetical protein